MTRQTRRIKYAVGLSFIVAAMIVAFAVAKVSAQVYPSGMVSYWKLDGNLTDELGNYDGTMGSYGSYVDGFIDQGLYGRMGCSNPFAAKVDNFPNLDSFTIETWVKPACPPNSWQGSLTVTKWKETGYYDGIGFMLFTVPFPYGSSDYIFQMSIKSETSEYQTIRSPLTYPCDNWHHVVALRDRGNVLKLFVNGEEVASAVDDFVGSIANTESLFFHGFTSGGCGWGMSAITMDEVAIYDRVLSEAEIQQHYQNGLRGLGYEVVIIPVPIDIKPQSCPNPLNVKSKGVLPVAILGTVDFDVTDIDLASIRLEGVAPIRSSIEDVSTPLLEKQDECDCISEGEDGIDDLTLKFDTQEIVSTLGEVADGDELVLTLTGELSDGTPIEGKDCIIILSKGKGKEK